VGLPTPPLLYWFSVPMISFRRAETDTMSELLYEQESYAIQGAVFEVYNEMGSGFLETVDQEMLAIGIRLPCHTLHPSGRVESYLQEKPTRADLQAGVSSTKDALGPSEAAVSSPHP